VTDRQTDRQRIMLLSCGTGGIILTTHAEIAIPAHPKHFGLT